MDRRTKRTALLLLGVALSAAVLLSAALSNLKLGAGDPFPGPSGQGGFRPFTSQQPVSAQAGTWPVFSGILAAVLAVLFIYLLFRLLTFTNIRTLIGLLIGLGLVLALLLSLPRVAPGPAVALPPETAAESSALPESQATPLGAPPTLVLWLVGSAIILGVAAASFAALRRHAQSSSPAPAVARAAELAAQQLRLGLESADVVVRCYLDMARVISEQRGLERERNLTVREFESALDDLALPREPLVGLRTLFESVRYGSRDLTAEEKAAAIRCLDQIVEAVRAAP